ncbi:FliG C-terminal domain-containing protein [Anaerocolumna sp.]|uniref:FliG C-terminal domain-containing protein n=1 Tax=Anaerocolumna sp. TaxID=2041569 RepID=UPI0028A62A28|nr:FliG C-terminal domain-containing protein [Anaerocolumna sp.]
MKLFSFTSLLPEELQMKYYESIIQNGFINDDLWSDIDSYIKSAYKKVDNREEEIGDILKNLDSDNREVLLEIIKSNNNSLFQKLSSKLLSFEDIANVDSKLLKLVLDNYSREDVFKALKAASPKVKDIILSLVEEGDSTKVNNESVPISEIVEIQDRIIQDINNISGV